MSGFARSQGTHRGYRLGGISETRAGDILNSSTARSKGELEDEAEVLLQKVGPEERAVDLLQPGQLPLLALGQVLLVPPDRIAGALQLARVSVLAAVPGVVPDLAPDLVEGLGRPGHGVEGVRAGSAPRPPIGGSGDLTVPQSRVDRTPIRQISSGSPERLVS